MPKLAVTFLSRRSRSRGDPGAQLAGQLPRLLDACFRHEDDEFIATVARNHVGTPAILLKNMADALQHDVTFEMPVKIVHELEAVEIHQHQSKRTIGAR